MLPEICRKTHQLLLLNPASRKLVLDIFCDTVTFKELSKEQRTECSLLLIFDRTLEESKEEMRAAQAYFDKTGHNPPEFFKSKWWKEEPNAKHQ